MRPRPPIATLLASLAAHGGALASLLFLVSSESRPSVLFIDLETLAEREAAVAATESRPAPPAGAMKRASAGTPRAAGHDAGRSGAAAPAAPPLAPLPTPATTSEPERARDREPAPTPPQARQPEPVVAVVPARDVAPDVAARSEASVPTPEPPANPGNVAGERTAAPAAAAGRDAESSGVGGRGPSAGTAGRPGGAGDTALTLGGPGGGAPGAEYGGYLNQMRRRLMEALRYPPPARNRGLTGTVTLDISIESSGAIADVSVMRSSSHPLLDEAALEAARSLTPQPFPRGLAPRPLRVRLPVVFDLQ